MPVNVEDVRKEAEQCIASIALDTKLQSMGSAALPLAYKRRMYNQGYDAFQDGFTIRACGYSTRGPAYEFWVAGYAEAFREYTKPLPTT